MLARGLRIAAWTVASLVALLLAVWLGGSLLIKLVQMPEEEFTNVAPLVGRGLLSFVECSVLGCPPELLEGMETVEFGEGLLESTPVAIEIDERGRVLVAETLRQSRGAEDNRSHMYWLTDDLASRSVEDRTRYYRKWLEAGKFEDPDHFTAAPDRVVAIEDLDGDGVGDARTVLAEWNEMASGLVAGIEAREGEIFVTSIPSVYRIEDRDADGTPESVETVHTGFGVKTSLIGHDLHGLVWGPDGKLYFSMGDRGYRVETAEGRVLEPALGPGRGAVFRMNPDGSGLEVFATGVRNPQELAFDDHGNLFTGDNNGDGGDRARLVYLVEGGETGWAMPYQTLVGDYVRGPWVAERLWEKQHPTQPAWVLPPVDYIGNGPAGFAHYPGLGLPERYDDAFFLCDYGYTPARSGIWAFGVEPDGAGMKMVDRHPFAWSLLATDVDFGWDGRIYASLFDQFGGGQTILRWRHGPSHDGDPRISEIARFAEGRMRDRETDELIGLLSFPDQRLRTRAQYALAERGATEALAVVLRNEEAEVVPRLHALWGLGQIGAEALAVALPGGLADLEGAPTELRAKAARAAGDAGWDAERATLLRWLRGPSLRIRFFAAEALGKLGRAEDIDALFVVLAENDDRDVFLRHAAVWAIHGLATREDARGLVLARRSDPERAVRMGVLLALRHAEDAEIASFLDDEDPLLVVEAARAIYDLPLDDAMAPLAGLASSLEPATAEDRQVGQALHRRVIGANVRLRTRDGAAALARYAADEAQLESLRSIALEALGSYAEPPLRDLTMGFYRPLPPADPALVAEVFRLEGRALVDSSLGARALEIANQVGELPVEDEGLVELAQDAGRPAAARASALRALATREAAGVDRAAIARGALGDGDATIRSAARTLLLAVDPEAGLDEILRAAQAAPADRERQHAWTVLGSRPSERGDRALEAGLASWSEEGADLASGLELLESAVARGGALAARAEGALAPAAVGDVTSLVAARRWALAGGDPERGRSVFQTNGDCMRCHGGGGGHGGGVGPALAGVSARGVEHVLGSILAPQAEIADGFASIVVTRRDGSTVSGLLVDEDDAEIRLDVGEGVIESIEQDAVAARTEPSSGMPPMGLVLPPRDLRDVVAYVMSLE